MCVFNHVVMDLFTQQVFILHTFCARHCVDPGIRELKTDGGSAFMEH